MNGIPIIKANTCATCSFKVGAADVLYCRFNPPTNVPVVMPDKTGKPFLAGSFSVFPKVEPHWWCGQFKAGLMRTDAVDEVPNVMTAQ